MGISTPSQSPAIVTREIDLTGVVPNVPTSTGAFVGEFRWGPVEQPTLISNEARLVEKFGTPNDDNSVEWHSAAYFLRYSNELQVVRMVAERDSIDDAVNTTALNAFPVEAANWTLADSSEQALFDSADGAYIVAPLVKNRDNFDNQVSTLASNTLLDVDSAERTVAHTFIAKYPGELGNSLSVHWFRASGDSTASVDSDWNAWAYASSFDGQPGTSDHASDGGSSNDEMHVVVVDRLGRLTGTRGSVVETFPYVSVIRGALNADGSSNYALDVVNNASNYVWFAGWGLDSGESNALFRNNMDDGSLPGTVLADSASDYGVTGASSRSNSVEFQGGADGAAIGTSQYALGFDLFEDVETITVDFLIAPGMATRTAQTTVVNDLVAIAQGIRKDCIVTASPARSDIINNNDPVTATVATAATFTQSSYLVMDNNYFKVYDKYNDKYINIPANSSVAGIMAATDAVAAPWYSPAGPRRGQVLGVTALAYSPKKTERDTLYKAGVNPIANIPGQGVLLFGDKTKLARPSAFDRINVRRLFLAIERAIAIAARNVMFEFNDEFTRAEFKNVVEPFLREIQGRRGITDFRVVCDSTNNTAAVIDRNEFVCSIFVKPARSINYVTLNFVAVRTGVDFEEVVGTV